MGFLLAALKVRPTIRVSLTGRFLKRTNQLLSSFLRCRCTGVEINSVSGVWEDELSVGTLKRIESHWKNKINEDRPEVTNPETRYVLSMFPYPSGNLHMGHIRVYTMSDCMARFYRMKGMTVIHPIGWDSFGLPAENAAIEKGAQPAEWTTTNISTMRNQMLQLGYSFDWDREISTCDPAYYKWTQFLFLKFFHEGYAFRRQAAVNWDPVDQTVLADEQVDANGCSWRSGAKVEKRCLRQWFIRTSLLSQALYDGLNSPILKRWKDIIAMQRHWIGQCNGFIMDLKLLREGSYLDDTMSVWIERPELLYGVAFLTVPSYHFLNDKECVENRTNVHAVHPLTNDLIPIFIDDTLTVAKSSSHAGIPCVSLEDHVFAEKHKLAITNVIQQEADASEVLCNSQEFSRLPVQGARTKICNKIKDAGVLCYPAPQTQPDWLISRQRYWGTPIPIVHCQTCGVVPVPFEDLPVTLPNITVCGKGGTSPLASAEEWINTKCPKCGNDAKRETDTMDTFVDSSWYYLRYLDANNGKLPFDPIKVENVMPVDLYIGGKEHAIMHLFYARFVCSFLHSLGYLKHPEPFSKLLVQGFITAESYSLKNSGVYVRKEDVDFSGQSPKAKRSGEKIVVQWEKMSKSKYNGVEVKDMVNEYGVDLLRLCTLANYSPFTQRKWLLSEFPPLLKWMKKMWQTVKEFRQHKEAPIDTKPISEEERAKNKLTLREKRNFFVQLITYQMEVVNDFRNVINAFKTMSSSLRNTPTCMWADCHEFERMLAALIIMMAPIAPQFASELWAGFSSLAEDSTDYNVKKPVLSQAWPEIDDGDFPVNFVITINGKIEAEEKITFQESKLFTTTTALERLQAMEQFSHITHDKIKQYNFNNEASYKETKIDLVI